MEVAIITDTHFGVRNDNVAFMDMTKKFLDHVFFSEIDKRGIRHVIHLGDLFDRRKMTNTMTVNRLRTDFIQPILNRDLEYHQVIGNHDTYYKNTNEPNAPEEFYSNLFSIYKYATDIKIGEAKILIVPWICDKNRKHSIETINNSYARVCMGHLELEGFDMYRGSTNTHGDDPSLFDRFPLTLSGHYHHKSRKGSIAYLGSHGQFTWSDYGDDRGFHILDLETLDLKFIKNPYEMFRKIFYSDLDVGSIEQLFKTQDWSKYSGTLCKIIIQNKTNPYWFDLFCEQLEKVGPLDIQIVEDHLNMDTGNDFEIISEAESTLDIFKKHIEQLDSSTVNTKKLESVITNLYNKAISMGVE